MKSHFKNLLVTIVALTATSSLAVASQSADMSFVRNTKALETIGDDSFVAYEGTSSKDGSACGILFRVREQGGQFKLIGLQYGAAHYFLQTDVDPGRRHTHLTSRTSSSERFDVLVSASEGSFLETLYWGGSSGYKVRYSIGMANVQPTRVEVDIRHRIAERAFNGQSNGSTSCENLTNIESVHSEISKAFSLAIEDVRANLQFHSDENRRESNRE